jgi:hypothetical protein
MSRIGTNPELTGALRGRGRGNITIDGVPWSGLFNPDGSLIPTSTTRDAVLDGRRDGLAVPTVLQFSSIIGSAWKTYLHGKFDEAMKFDREWARTMWRDAFLRGLFNRRVRAVARLPWQLHVPDEKDKSQVKVRDGLTKVLQSTPSLRRMMRYWLYANWFGRYAVQVSWRWDRTCVPGRRALKIKRFAPVNGDKIGYTHSGVPYVLVYASLGNTLPDAQVINTTIGGRGLVVNGRYRERFLFHNADADDADFFQPQQADAIHGVGVRSLLHFTDWMRKEWVALLADYLERVGLGVTLWFYDAGNPAGKAEAERAAREQTGRVNIVWPRSSSGQGSGAGVERLEVPTQGASILQQLIAYLEGHEELVILGTRASEFQGRVTASAEEEASGQVSDVVYDDADDLGDTITGSDEKPGLLSITKKWTFPEADFPVWFRFNLEAENPAAKMAALTGAWSMGAVLKEQDVREAAGASDPKEGDSILAQGLPPGSIAGEGGRPDLAAAAAEMQAAGMAPGPGGPGGPGGPPGGSSAPPPGGDQLQGPTEDQAEEGAPDAEAAAEALAGSANNPPQPTGPVPLAYGRGLWGSTKRPRAGKVVTETGGGRERRAIGGSNGAADQGREGRPDRQAKTPAQFRPGEYVSDEAGHFEPQEEPDLNEFIRNKFTHDYGEQRRSEHSTGFILSDGRPVGMGVRPGLRDSDHREAIPTAGAMKRWGWPADVVKHYEEGTRTPGLRELMRRSGALRVISSPEQLILESHAPVTGAQRRAVLDHIAKHRPQLVYFDLQNAAGKNLDKEFEGEDLEGVEEHMRRHQYARGGTPARYAAEDWPHPTLLHVETHNQVPYDLRGPGDNGIIGAYGRAIEGRPIGVGFSTSFHSPHVIQMRLPGSPRPVRVVARHNAMFLADRGGRVTLHTYVDPIGVAQGRAPRSGPRVPSYSTHLSYADPNFRLARRNYLNQQVPALGDYFGDWPQLEDGTGGKHPDEFTPEERFNFLSNLERLKQLHEAHLAVPIDGSSSPDGRHATVHVHPSIAPYLQAAAERGGLGGIAPFIDMMAEQGYPEAEKWQQMHQDAVNRGYPLLHHNMMADLSRMPASSAPRQYARSDRPKRYARDPFEAHRPFVDAAFAEPQRMEGS